MNESMYLSLTLLFGLMLGIFFFGGLWITIKKTITTQHSIVWITASFLVRLIITMLGFYYVASNSWQRQLFCVLGFIIARFIVVRITKLTRQRSSKKINDEN